jgi:DNA invertase Pin-like site-specific DNA recombinase
MLARQTTIRAVGYVRVSTEGQAEEGVSLAAQRRKLDAQALAQDMRLAAVHEDAGVSAKSLDRPGLKAALLDLEEGRADALIVCKLDRLTRSVRDLGLLVESYFASRFQLISIADAVDTRTAGGRLVLNVLVSVAQWEREANAERTSEALRHMKAQGRRLGAAALGWRWTQQERGKGKASTSDVPSEVETVIRMHALRGAGLSLRAICSQLEAEGRATKRGGRWTPKVVRDALRRGPQPSAAAV